MIKRRYVLLVCLLMLSVLTVFVVLRRNDTVNINKTEIVIERAVTDEERQLGLGNYESLEDNQGLLFEFDAAGTHGIWMKDVEFPIDVLWLDNDKKIVHIEANMQPDSYPTVFRSDELAQYVLEVPAGFVSANGIKEGQRAQFDD
jgi:uncharacterized membrane protein (UPF0127 family)